MIRKRRKFIYIINLFLYCIFITASFRPILLHAQDKLVLLGGDKQGWKAWIHTEKGIITEYRHLVKGNWEVVPFRKDSMAGPCWKGVWMSPDRKRPLSFEASQGAIHYRLTYREAKDHLVLECTLTNKGNVTFQPEFTRLQIGVDAEMKTFPEWDTKYFPTLLRCERDFAWGYFMSPRQCILGIGVEEPVASYALNYIYEGITEWKWGHQIKTASWDLMHVPPLPERHPDHCYSLHPGEIKKWTFHLGGISDISEVQKRIAHWIQAPMLQCEKYTMGPKDRNRVCVYSNERLKSLSVITPGNIRRELATTQVAPDQYMASLDSLEEKGIYRIQATAMNGKTAEAVVYVRHAWSWYLKNARDFVAENPPLFSNSCETFYGYYTAFLAARHFPDRKKDFLLEERFNRTLSQFIDTVTWLPKKEASPDRVQNFSSLIGMLVDLWEATGKQSYLEKAARVGDYLCSEKIQASDGSYRSKGTHYTAVIYPVKSMLELLVAEKYFMDDAVWAERYGRHKSSAAKAVSDLLKRRDDIQTEGDMTFEDGMITCSALQIALWGLSETDSVVKRQCVEVARYLMDKHRCLEQLVIPDCRMRGGTLRYWEALDIYFVPNQVMSSPHGWTAWKIYACYYLYLLTGEPQYLSDFMDTMGACAQIMDLDGNLRWGFIPDPYVKGKVCVEREDKIHEWHPVDSIVGEQYLDMISPWLRPDDEDMICSFGGRGGAGDNTVQEIFKAMEECALTSAYVVVGQDRKLQSWNCTVSDDNGVLHIVPEENIIKRIHLNLAVPVDVKVHMDGKDFHKKNCTGMIWIGNKPFF